MNFDDHAIWDMPVPDKSAPVETPQAPATVEARTESGRIYRSGRVTGHPEAILALAERRQSNTPAAEELLPEPVAAAAPAVEPEPVPAAAEAAVSAEDVDAVDAVDAITPETAAVDAPLAHVVDEPIADVAASVFGDAFPGQDDVLDLVVRETGSTLPAPAAPADAVETPRPETPQPETRPSLVTIRSNAVQVAAGAAQVAAGAKDQLAAFNEHVNTGTYDLRRIATYLFVPTALAAVGEAFVADMLGWVTGAMLVVITALLTLKVDAERAWSTQVLPAFVLVAAVLVGGQFAATAPGLSPLGQIMLVATSCITLAPWLAGATLIGAVVPRLRHRAGTPVAA